MTELLTANFARIKKSKLFWSLCGAVAVVALLIIFNAFSYYSDSVDNIVRAFVIPTEIAAAIFISIFFGTEYSDGTMRNKLIVGHDRKAIYLANLVTALACALGFTVSYMIPVAVVGLPCFGLPTGKTVAVFFAGIVTVAAFCALFAAVSTNYSNKAGATVINIMLAFALLVAGVLVCGKLMSPEFLPSYGMGSGAEFIPNPHYVGGIMRAVLTFVAGVLPGGQAVQFLLGLASPLWTLALYSAVLGVACSAVGMALFVRKNIK